MQDALAQLISYLLGVWRHRWLALVAAWVVALAGWAYVWQLPESYVATARVYVDTNSVLRPLMRGLTITPDINRRISLMTQTLLSRPNLEKLARMTDLDVHATSERQEDELIQGLRDSISLSGSRANASLYSISVSHANRDTARRITQALLTVFIETSMADKREDSAGAQSFLDQQLADSEQRLVAAENRLSRFKQEHVDVLPGGGGDYYSRLQAARGDLEQARLALSEVESREATLRRQIEGEEPVFIPSDPGATSTAFDQRIQALQVQMDGLLARYTRQHPEVARLRGLIEELKQEREAVLAQRGDAVGSPFGGSAGLGGNPVYQGMRSMLAEAQAQAAELRVRVREYEERVTRLEGMVNRIPEVEADLKQLNRDYDVLSRQHQQMLERRESARLAGEVESTAGEVTFRVIDPPFVPLTPSEPNKLLLNSAVLVLAIAAGVGVALLLALIRPVVTDARMLAYSTGAPLLGVVTWNKTAEERRSDLLRLGAFGVCASALLVSFAGALFGPVLLG